MRNGSWNSICQAFLYNCCYMPFLINLIIMCRLSSDKKKSYIYLSLYSRRVENNNNSKR